jgi:hypothetical protein
MKISASLSQSRFHGFKEFCQLALTGGLTFAGRVIKIFSVRSGFTLITQLGSTIRMMYHSHQIKSLKHFDDKLTMKIGKKVGEVTTFQVWEEMVILTRNPRYLLVKQKLLERCYPYKSVNLANKQRVPWGVYFQIGLLLYGFYFLWTWRVVAGHDLPGATQSGGVVSQTSGLLPPSTDFITPQVTPTAISAGLLPPAVASATISPTAQILPTSTPGPLPTVVIEMGRFSFYDPEIGRDKPEIALVNCAKWNAETKQCDSLLNNGERYQDNYYKAAACRYDLYLQKAEFEVLAPDWLRALFPAGFVCKDTGEAVTGLFFDFLIPWQSMPMAWDQTPWGSPIALRRLK